MKPYLVRGGIDPRIPYSPYDLAKKDFLGGNSGNMMFLYGTMNVLTTSKTDCVSTFYKRIWSEAEIDEINQTYSAFVIPLADAFREGFVPKLRSFTKMIEQLTIPCIVNGVGIRGPYEPNITEAHSYDDDVKAFVKAVLDHSSMLGLRGSITGDYLTRLGFRPEIDFTVIGCPSLYMHGPLMRKPDTGTGRLAINLNGLVSSQMTKFYLDLIDSHEDIHLIQQRTQEFLDLYYSLNVDLHTNVKEFPNADIFPSFDFARMKKEGRVHFFLDVPSWIRFLNDFDLFIGARFHGTVAALLAGLPAVMTPFDARTREFSDYHQIPTITDTDLSRPDSMEELLSGIDLNSFFAAQEKNLEHYKTFLKANNLYSIFDENIDCTFGHSPMEQALLKTWKSYDLQAFACCSPIERVRRKTEYHFRNFRVRAKNIIKNIISLMDVQ